MWWRRKRPEPRSSGEPSGPNVLKTADEFQSADQLDDVPADPDIVNDMEHALERLRGQHLAFQAPERCDECSLEELRLRILRAVTRSDDLESYYREAWGLPPGGAPTWESHFGVKQRHVAVMQIELMVRAFNVLHLQLFANAPENHGWMTLFRNWGRSPRFNQVFDEVAPTLAPEFTKFYQLYLRNLPPRASASGHLPVHHPWLRPLNAQGRGMFMDSGRGEPEVDVRESDLKSGPGADRGYERSSDSGDTGGGPPSAPNE